MHNAQMCMIVFCVTLVNGADVLSIDTHLSMINLRKKRISK